jgi:hypothetical protein
MGVCFRIYTRQQNAINGLKLNSDVDQRSSNYNHSRVLTSRDWTYLFGFYKTWNSNSYYWNRLRIYRFVASAISFELADYWPLLDLAISRCI